MTRINTCSVTELSDQHLRGEYKEISRVFTNTLKCISTKGVEGAYQYIKQSQPKQYTVQTKDNPSGGKGHEMFFRDKLSYISDRYTELAHEMQVRGNNVNWGLVDAVITNAEKKILDKRFWRNYTPDQQAYELNKKRRAEVVS